MKYILIIQFLLFSVVSIGQANTSKLSKSRWQRYSSNTENSIQKLNQGHLYGGDWKIQKHTTKGGFSWVQFEMFWTTTEGERLGFIAEDIQELEKICLRIENSYLKESNNSKGEYSKIDDILYMPFQGEFLIDASFKKNSISASKKVKKPRDITLKRILKEGWEKGMYNVTERKSSISVSGVAFNKEEAAVVVTFLREQYQYFKGFMAPSPKCNSVRFGAISAFDDEEYALAANKYNLFLAMNCAGLTLKRARQYGEALVNTEQYDSAIKFYTAIEDKSIDCKYYNHLGEFYFKNGKIKKTYLKDFKGALADLNAAIALRETGGRFFVRGLIYEKMDRLEDAKKDKAFALRLDSIYYTKQLNINLDKIARIEDKPNNSKYIAKYYRNNINNNNKLKMYARAKQDSLLAMVHDTIYIQYTIKKINIKIKEYQKLSKKTKKNFSIRLGLQYAERAKNYTLIGLNEKALEDYKTIIKSGTASSYTYLNICKHFLRLSDYKKALEAINKAISLDYAPSASNLEIKGDVLIKLKQQVEACEVYKQLLELNFESVLLKELCESRE